jgi:hypothetical protein
VNPDRWAAAWPFLRDAAIVITALGMFVFEVIGEARQEVLLACTGLLLSPVFLRGDAKDRKDREEPDPKPREADR